ncbi:DUF4231 domain-containing protein [Amycolatopsis sp. NPDC004169]|uniref:DUF4231 domain-containing protein n=1 Tax=Amycolatopsis sp. NPDC004169 TaxID=3154453 RepID=UPI0033BBE4BD
MVVVPEAVAGLAAISGVRTAAQLGVSSLDASASAGSLPVAPALARWASVAARPAFELAPCRSQIVDDASGVETQRQGKVTCRTEVVSLTKESAAVVVGGAEPHWIEDAAGDEPVVPAPVMAKWRWYRLHATRACRSSHRSEVLNLVLAALTPAVTLVVNQPVAGATVGTAAVIVAGIRSTYRWQENWISRSRARYAIERQIAHFKHRVAPYDNADAEAVLVKAVEDIAEAEGHAWENNRRSSSRPSANI